MRGVSVPFRKVGTLRDHDIMGGCVTEALEVFAEPIKYSAPQGVHSPLGVSWCPLEEADSLKVGGPRGPLDDSCPRGPQSTSLGLSHPSVLGRGCPCVRHIPPGQELEAPREARGRVGAGGPDGYARDASKDFSAGGCTG